MASGMWEEVLAVKTENRRELNLQGPFINKRIEDRGLDEGVFTLTGLNLLKIAGTPLESLSEKLGNLNNLTSLMLENNKLKELPSSVGNLVSLKFLDISGNKLESLPDTLSNLVNIQSLNANLNNLQSFPDVSNMKVLAYLSIARNKLSALPPGVCDPSLTLLSTIDAANNEITSIPTEISNLTHLIKLDVTSNKLDSLPLELCECPKLREVIIVDNKMKDRKLLKLAEHSTKALLNYLKTQLDKQQALEKGNKKDKSKKSNKKKGDKKEVEDLERDIISVLQFEVDNGFVITATQAVMSVRQYIVCCIIKNLDFSKSNNMFKRFINLQTKLHESICEKRQTATIATHDFKLIKAPLVYDALRPHVIQITPLFKTKVTTAEILMKELRDEAEAFRKEKKRSTLSGIHKYLDLLKDKTHYPCLKDADGDVISFPPITNSEKTKISKETTDILIEVTSSTNLDVCKKVLEEMLRETLLLGVGTPGSDVGEKEVEGEAPKEVDTSRMRFPQKLTVEQVKVIDAQGNLRVIFPSRVDLQNPAYDVIRNYE
ncbi:leucine-rich repeat-containing protein 47-like [Physella acuta]|uniref:leucine-rich repeat-containing protein 47-like n=1 Tax=Physella acuta TaxID=109671 RepID=UPI0027DDEE51|nr:leucine-rich repeat-containing protein 47-like [Physella acuta]